MYNVIFNSGFIGFLIWLLLFAVSTAALAIAIRCAWSLRASLFATREFKEKLLLLLRQGEWQGAFDYCSAHSTLAATMVSEVLLLASDMIPAGRFAFSQAAGYITNSCLIVT